MIINTSVKLRESRIDGEFYRYKLRITGAFIGHYAR